MTIGKRVALALLIFGVDLAVFFVPLSALLLVAVVLARPQWFKRLVDRVYE